MTGRRIVVVALTLVVGLVAVGAWGLDATTTTSPARRPATSQPVAAASSCPSAGPQEGAVFCAEDTDTPRRRGAQALRVQQDDVIAALEDAAAHYPTRVPAVGAGCGPPVQGDGIGLPWACVVNYQSTRASTVSYSMVVRGDGCWTAAAVPGLPRTPVAPTYRGCGLRVRASARK